MPGLLPNVTVSVTVVYRYPGPGLLEFEMGPGGPATIEQIGSPGAPIADPPGAHTWRIHTHSAVQCRSVTTSQAGVKRPRRSVRSAPAAPSPISPWLRRSRPTRHHHHGLRAGLPAGRSRSVHVT